MRAKRQLAQCRRVHRAVRKDRRSDKKQLRPGVRIVMIGPPDGARAKRDIKKVHAELKSDGRATAIRAALPTPPKLGAVREAHGGLSPSASEPVSGTGPLLCQPIVERSLGRSFPAADGP